MAPEVEGHHVVVAAEEPGQLVQVGLCRVQSRTQDQRSSPAAAGYRDPDAVVVDREVPHRPVASLDPITVVGRRVGDRPLMRSLIGSGGSLVVAV